MATAERKLGEYAKENGLSSQISQVSPGDCGSDRDRMQMDLMSSWVTPIFLEFSSGEKKEQEGDRVIYSQDWNNCDYKRGW